MLSVGVRFTHHLSLLTFRGSSFDSFLPFLLTHTNPGAPPLLFPLGYGFGKIGVGRSGDVLYSVVVVFSMESGQGKGKVNMRSLSKSEREKLSVLIERMWYFTRSIARRRDALIMGAGLLGLRWVEVSRLRWMDVVREGDLLRVRTAKGGRERTVETGKSWGQGIELMRRRGVSKDPAAWLFVTSSGRPVSYDQVIRRCRAWSKEATGQIYTFHCLRHSFAVSLYEQGMDVLEISRSLGHKSLQWTSTYLKTIVPCATAGGIGFTKDDGRTRSLRLFDPKENER